MDLKYLVSRYILLPIGKTYSGRNYFKAIKTQKYLEKTQYFDRCEIEKIRDKKFKYLVSHCYQNVPYYRRYMVNNNLSPDDFKSTKDIKHFPLMTKKILKANQDLLRASNYNNKMVRKESTGNTTGEPINFLRDLSKEYIVDANNWRFQKYAGFLQGMQTAFFWGNIFELINIKSGKEKLKNLMNNTVVLNFYNLTTNSLDQYFEYMQKAQPRIIRGYASGIYHFVNYCNLKGFQFNYKPKCIILTSDKIYEPQKRSIKKYFGCEIFEEYGCREFSFLAYECSKHNGLHLAEELFIFEILDKFSGKTDFEGKGEIVVTPLNNYAMPLIRYCLEDEVSITSKYCTCGRNLKLITDIEGKITDFVVTKSGKLIWGSFFAYTIYPYKGINTYQVTQNEIGKVDINIIKNKYFAEEEMVNLKTTLNEICSDDLEIYFNYVSKIKPSPSGKRRSVISNIAQNYLPT